MEKSDTQKRVGSKKTKILILLMFLGLISPKAWGYAEKELPPSFSEDAFSFDDNPSLSRAVLNGSELSEAKFNNDTFSFSRAILTDEKGVAICQVNLVEKPQFLPEFAEPGLSEGLEPLDLPECKEESLDIVAQYAEQAWVEREVAFAPAVAIGSVSFIGGCVLIFSAQMTGVKKKVNIALPASIGGIQGTLFGIAVTRAGGMGWFKLKHLGIGAISGAIGGLICSGIADRILYE